jgi:hypothetical protein
MDQKREDHLMRMIILHYHLFKNAGTSVDHVLRRNFPNAWVSHEFSGKGGYNTSNVAQCIAETPQGVAFSSHTMLGPVPQIAGVQIVPVVLLRDPVDRIHSTYHFERQQQADTKGAQLAKTHDLMGYIKARLAISGDRQCRNFQTARLASMIPGPQNELSRAIEAAHHVQRLGVLDLVPEFRSAMMRLSARVSQSLGALDIPDIRANRAATPRGPLAPQILNPLITENGDNLAFLDHVHRQHCAA